MPQHEEGESRSAGPRSEVSEGAGKLRGWLGRLGSLADRCPVRALQVVTCVLLLVMLASLLRHRHDIDESQNLHIVYGWVEGELPYRDRFDNHAPLFAFAYAPLAAMVGESEFVVWFARLGLVPVWLTVLGLILLISRRLGGSEAGWWTLVLCLAFADFSLKLLEFRPDVLWAAFWFAGLLLVLRGIQSPRGGEAFAAGACFALALLTSIKTTFLLPALVLSAGFLWLLAPAFRERVPVAKIATLVLTSAAGFLIPLVMVAIGFGAVGIRWEEIYFSLVEINRKPFEVTRIVLMTIAAPAVPLLGWIVLRRGGGHREERSLVLMVSLIYLLLLLGFAPESRKQTFLVVTPLVIASAVWIGFGLIPARWVRLAGAACCLGFFIHFVAESRLWKDGMREQRELLAEVLHLTRPGEALLDNRGETIFRPRPVYPAFVAIVRDKIDADLLPSPAVPTSGPERAPFSIGPIDGMPKSIRAIMKKHYLLNSTGRLRAAGYPLALDSEDGSPVSTVDLRMAGDYLLVADGEVLDRLTFEEPGRKSVELPVREEPFFLIWEQAWKSGFRPANAIDAP